MWHCQLFFLVSLLFLVGCTSTTVDSPDYVVSGSGGIGTSQWGGDILDNDVVVYYDFETDCTDVMGNFDCSLSSGATVVDGKLFLNRTANTAMRAEIFQQDFDLNTDFCIAFDVIEYNYTDGRFLHFQDNDQLDIRKTTNALSQDVIFISTKNATGSYKNWQGTEVLPGFDEKWSYIISFDTTNSELVSWVNGTVDFNETDFQGFSDLTDITMQFPRNSYAGIGYMDNLVFMNTTCDQTFVDSWMGSEEEPPEDTCTYASGNHTYEGSDNCDLSSDVNVDEGALITINGTGTFTGLRYIKGAETIRIQNGCTVKA